MMRTLSTRGGATPLCIAVALLAAAPERSAASAEAAPWEGPAFSATPAALLEAARKVSAPAGAEVSVLFDESHYRFEADGREAFWLRRVFKVNSAAGATSWGTVALGWAPWYQDKPTLRARVVTPDGKTHELDPKTIEIVAEDQSDDQVLSDRREVRAPLPAMTTGAVVEELFEVVDQSPQFRAGLVEVQPLGLHDVRIERQRVVISAPASLALKTAVYLSPGLHPTETRRGADVELTFDVGPLDPVEPQPHGWPLDRPARPGIGMSTGASWADVAAGYAKLVDPQRAPDGAVKSVVHEVLTTKPAADGGAKPAAGKTANREEQRRDTIARILARVQRDVRYTGVELGSASIVPRTPGEVLTRRYGDCKDKALLLAALLGEAGIEARVALLRAGTANDVDPSLPGFGMFNHAIVFVPGPKPLWIDATAQFVPLGTLPRGDQGRLALVVDRGTRALLRTPIATPEENKIVETRELQLSDLGKARLVETTDAWGAPAERYRSYYADADPKKVNEGLEKYVRETYQADAVAKYTMSEPYAVDGAFRLRIEATNAGVAQTYENGATITLPCGQLFSRLPDDLRESPDDEAKDDAAGARPGDKPAGAAKKKRTEDYVLYEPFIQEWRYRLIPPAGMAAAQLPESETIPLGPAKLTKTFAREVSGTVTATFRLDTVKTRYTAAESEALRAAMGKLFKGDASVVRFEQVGLTHLQAGRVSAAIAEFRRLRELNPARAIHRVHLAEALLRAGLGEAARTEIREAIAADPKSSRAYAIQGWILQHDLVGRRFKTGSDLPGAEAAYRKAKQLDPKDVGARADLAILYEFWPAGVQRGPKARLADAITEWRAMSDADLTQFRDNLLLDLTVTEHWADVIKLARPWPSTQVRDAALLAALAAEKGASAALAEVPSVVPEAAGRSAALQAAGVHLMLRRRYPLAAALMAEAASGRGPEVRVLAETLQRVKRRETVKLNEQPGDALARSFIVQTLVAAQDRSFAGVRPLMADELFGNDGPAAEAEFLAAADAAMSTPAVASLTPAVLADIVASLDEFPRSAFTRDGNDKIGYRFRTLGGQAVRTTIFAAMRNGALKIVALGELPSTLGRQSLRALAAGDREAARRWLDWAYDLQPIPEDDPLSGGSLLHLWSRSSQAEDRVIEIAAAAIISEGGAEAHSIDVLSACRAAHRTEDETLGCAHALARTYMVNKRFAEALPIAEELDRKVPQSMRAFELHAGALFELKRYSEVSALADARAKRLPGDIGALRWSARAAMAAGDAVAAERWYRAAVGRPEATANDFNDLAWNALFTGRKIDEADLEAARQAVSRSQRKAAAYLHTLATLDAEVGRSEEATAALLESLNQRNAAEPLSYDWYVVGRNAEQLGLPEAAIAAYRRVTPLAGAHAGTDAATLARRRLERLESRAAPAKSGATSAR